jgi:hypothetical protein
MKKIFTRIAVLTAVAGIGFSACKKEEKVNCNDFMAEFEALEELDEKFVSEPTTANCNAVKKATIDLFNKVKDCPGVDKSSIQPLIDEFQNEDCTTLESAD